MSLLELYNRFASLFHKFPNTTLILLPSTATYNHITPYDIYVRVANTLTAVQYTRLAAMSTGCGVEKCSDAVWLCSRMIGAVWQLGSPLPCAYPYFLLPPASCLLPLPAFSVSNFARLLLLRLSLTGWLCDAKFGLCMWPSRWPRAQTTIKLSTAFALATASNFPIVVQHRIATPRHAMPCHAMMASGESGTFSVFHVRWQRVFFHQRIGSTSVQCKRYSTIFRME